MVVRLLSIVLLALLAILTGCQSRSGGAMSEEEKRRACEEGLAVDLTGLKSDDGQPLIVIDDSPLTPPSRPADPNALTEEDALYWYDMEYAGWQGTKQSLPCQ